ncbi:MAG TPA: aldehyde dehydrogenase family protein [Acidobacteriota bacterium]|nr:aldehyde dehydrogenase family protein [Acidobacteriota bacterium]
MNNAERDRDLESIQEARQLGRAAVEAQRQLEGCTQEQIDAIVEEMAAAGLAHSEHLAELAHDETGFGNVPDKVLKNNFVLKDVVEAMRGMRTVGVLREDREHGVREIAEPVGVVAGIIPSTNPTSTAFFKCLIALKARCGIVLSPHPTAAQCVKASAEVMAEAAHKAGAPNDIIGCMSSVTMQGTRELMHGRETDIILATGGIGLVRAAYSAGKPAYGVGPGNVPAYIEETANVPKAVRDVISGTTFDNGTLCSSEQAIVCDRIIKDEVLEQARANGGHLLTPDECDRLAAVLITDRLLVNTDYVGRPATTIANAAGIKVPEKTRVLICPVGGVGKKYPLSHEKLSPVLAFYVVDDWQEGCQRCTELLRFGGMGHTMVIHSGNDDIVLEFGLRKPAHRVLVNTVAALGAVGHTTHLFPSMTLGCGSWGNNITSDNIGPQHLLNVKRLAYETREYIPKEVIGPATISDQNERTELPANIVADTENVAGDGLEIQIADFLDKRGLLPKASEVPPVVGRNAVISVRDVDASDTVLKAPPPPRGRPEVPTDQNQVGPQSNTSETAAAHFLPAEFVSEDDVRDACETGEKIGIGPDTIVTPLALELGETHDIFRRL